MFSSTGAWWEPGYAVSWSDALGTEWETPRGVRLKVEQPRVEAPTHGGDREAVGDVVHSPYDDHRGRGPLPAFLHLLQPASRRRCVGASPEPLQLLPLLRGVGRRRRMEKADYRDDRLRGDHGEQHHLWHGPCTGTAGADGDGVQGPERSAQRERYKIIHRGQIENGPTCVYGATSPDGLDWTAIEEPIIPDYFSDTQIVARFDEEIGRYRGYFRGWTQARNRFGARAPDDRLRRDGGLQPLARPGDDRHDGRVRPPRRRYLHELVRAVARRRRPPDVPGLLPARDRHHPASANDQP